MRLGHVSGLLAATWLALGTSTRAHDGPPFPIVSDRAAGPYVISVWTDPDTTDDRSAGGQFWVMLERSDGGAVPPDTRAMIVARPLDRSGPPETVSTEPVRGDAATQFGAVVLDHEGRFGVHVDVTGPLGRGEVDSQVSATYDLRPPAIMLALYLMPFLVVGILWTKLLLRRRRAGATGSAPRGSRVHQRERQS